MVEEGEQARECFDFPPVDSSWQLALRPLCSIGNTLR